jgi:hypothetical protein
MIDNTIFWGGIATNENFSTTFVLHQSGFYDFSEDINNTNVFQRMNLAMMMMMIMMIDRAVLGLFFFSLFPLYPTLCMVLIRKHYICALYWFRFIGMNEIILNLM